MQNECSDFYCCLIYGILLLYEVVVLQKIDLLQEYKELYYKEIEHSERLNSKINVCITFLTILGSAQILLWTQLKNFSMCIYTYIYFALCIISLVVFVISLFKFYKAYSKYNYCYFPIKKIALVTKETYEIAQNSSNPKKDRKIADHHVYDMYCERYLNDAIVNRNINIIKNDRHKKAVTYVCICFILTIITFSFGVGIDYYETNFIKENIQHIEIDGGEINVK